MSGDRATWERIVKWTRVVAWVGLGIGLLAVTDWREAVAIGAVFVCGYALGNVEAR